MISNRIKITEEGEVYDRLGIALAIRNSTYNDELKCSLMDQNIIKNCETCSLKFICDGIDGLADMIILKRQLRLLVALHYKLERNVTI